jgi:RTX calcium-binding nonapeptide repeat (4 copies)
MPDMKRRELIALLGGGGAQRRDDRVSGTDADGHDHISRNGSSEFGGNADSAVSLTRPTNLLVVEVEAPRRASAQNRAEVGWRSGKGRIQWGCDSSLDNLVLATAEYMGGNYDGRHPLDYYAHSSGALDVIARLEGSAFYDFMSPDSVLIFDAYGGPVTDMTPGRESIGAFYLGEAVADQIIGRAGNDFIEGFGGDDVLSGAAGNDRLDGGTGFDVSLYSGSSLSFSFTWNGSTNWTVIDGRQNRRIVPVPVEIGVAGAIG